MKDIDALRFELRERVAALHIARATNDLSRQVIINLLDALVALPFTAHARISTVVYPGADEALRTWVGSRSDVYLDSYQAADGWYVTARRVSDHQSVLKVNTGFATKEVQP